MTISEGMGRALVDRCREVCRAHPETKLYATLETAGDLWELAAQGKVTQIFYARGHTLFVSWVESPNVQFLFDAYQTTNNTKV